MAIYSGARKILLGVARLAAHAGLNPRNDVVPGRIKREFPAPPDVYLMSNELGTSCNPFFRTLDLMPCWLRMNDAAELRRPVLQ